MKALVGSFNQEKVIVQLQRLLVYSTSPDHRPFVHIVADTSSVSADKAQCATLLASRGENKQLWTTAPCSYHQFISESGHRRGPVC